MSNDPSPETLPPIDDTQTKPEETPKNAVLADIQSPQELTAYVETVLQQLKDKFDDLSSQLVLKMDDMGSRIDTLEKSLGELMQQTVSDEIIIEEAKT